MSDLAISVVSAAATAVLALGVGAAAIRKWSKATERLAASKERVDNLETGLNQRMDRLEARLSQRMDKLEASLKEELRTTQEDIKKILHALPALQAAQSTSDAGHDEAGEAGDS